MLLTSLNQFFSLPNSPQDYEILAFFLADLLTEFFLTLAIFRTWDTCLLHGLIDNSTKVDFWNAALG